MADYANPGSEKLNLILQLNDYSVANYHLKLRFEIKGNGFTLSTKTLYNPAPITLLPGQPLLLSGSDLAPYLASANLDFIGINQSQYEKGKALPEGYYSICVSAYDFYQSNPLQVSNSACAQAWFTLSDPPFLNQPNCNTLLIPQTPQNILFQWTPMNLGSPNSALNTEYDFALWEIRPDSTANPNQVVLSTAPIYSTSTQQTFINYGVTEPALNLYLKYVWRVRAKDNTGRDNFKNNGYSQTCTFTYGSLSNVIGNTGNITLNAQALTHRTGQCDWTKQSLYTSYLLQVRKQGTTFWFDYPNTSGIEKVSNLEPNTTYECQVQGKGNNLTSAWSNMATFTTADAPNYTCNDINLPNTGAQPKPLPTAKAIPGLVIQSGQFEIIATQIEASGMKGWYKGKGYALVFGGLPVAVKWDNIFIDEDNRQQQGVIEALTDGTDKWLQQWDKTQAEQNATYVNGTIDSVYQNGNQTCYTIQGSSNALCVNNPPGTNVIVIRDEEGNQYTIQLMPPPAKITGPSNYLNFSNDSLAANPNQVVYFTASPNQNYGFDKKEYAAFIANYEAIKLADGKNYFVPNKSIGQGQSDEVIAQIQIANFNPNNLSFKTGKGNVLNSSSTNVTNEFKITGMPADASCVYAWYNNQKIGKLNIVQLNSNNKKVVLVPVNSAALNTNNQQAALNEVFKQANVNWSVTTAPNFTFDLGTDGLEAADANLMSKYSNEMRALRNAYKNFDSLYDKTAYYLFVVPAFNNSQIKGYMVRGRALGFISAAASNKELAHELAHGAFGLEHTFPQLEKSSSNNLMDYNSGTQLVKEQWETIETGDFKLTWWDEEEDAAALTNKRQDLLKLLLAIKKGYKENATIDIGSYTSVMTIGKTYLNGIDYDDITTVIMPYVQTLGALTPNSNNITSSSFNGSYPYQGPNKPCIDIDGKIKIFVPANRIENMKVFLKSSVQLKNMLLFVNGYRDLSSFDGSTVSGFLEVENTNNTVNQADLFDYWSGIDQKFSLRIGTKNIVYADGHHSVATSNHGSVPRFLAAMRKSDNRRKFCANMNPSDDEVCNVSENDSPIDVDFIHSSPMNISGFNIRKTNGSIAGEDLVNKINNGTFDFDKNTDTLDIVAHSMGYAYSLGMIEKIKAAGIKLGRYYILAPENACSGGTDWKVFTEAWQYGSNLGEPNNDPMYLQDGVAPQCECANLSASNGQINTANGSQIKTGRVFIPMSVTTKGFVGSHSISNYGWIFNKQSTEDGYIKKRN